MAPLRRCRHCARSVYPSGNQVAPTGMRRQGRKAIFRAGRGP